MRGLVVTMLSLLDLFGRGGRRFFIRNMLINALLPILDTAALGLVVVAATSLFGTANISLPIVGHIDFAANPWIVALIAVLFVLKSALGLLVQWHVTRRLSTYEYEIGNRIFMIYARRPWEQRARLGTIEVTRLVDVSVGSAIRSYLLAIMQIPANFLTVIVAMAVLFIAQPITALVTTAYLAAISLSLSAAVSRRSKALSVDARIYANRVTTIVAEMVEALKEVTLRGKIDEAGAVISQNRGELTTQRGRLAFLAAVPRYVFEVTLIGGFVLVGGVAYLRGGVGEAGVAVSLFAVAGLRMIPGINAAIASVTAAFTSEVYAKEVISECADTGGPVVTEDAAVLPAEVDELQLDHVSFRYAGAAHDALTDVSLTIPMGGSVALVGPSGAGKSTLVDIILGLSEPVSGTISLDGLPLKNVTNQWRSHVGYVPQRVALFNGSIAQNVALTWSDDYDPARVERALMAAQADDLVGDRGITGPVGERGTSVSGGQQQRLGIARALYCDPLVVVMDEATSALDTATEQRVTEAMHRLKGSVTFITVAHRLATIRNYDQVCYVEGGRILGQGTFDDVVAAVPAFRRQAELAGLVDRQGVVPMSSASTIEES
ncbi:MAG: ABC transporter ATP-binding protein/permease [Promicromonosporaceae bacterium]|nr:ABC transporter ATP-binding protein/permease [Promicromonosporaceae bacterium]